MTDDHRLAFVAARAADAKGGADTVVIDVGDILAICSEFVITSAHNPRLVKALVEEIEARVKEVDGSGPKHVEGLDDLRWVLMDYGDFVVHVFLAADRAVYDLERLWADVPRLDWTNGGTGAEAAAGV